MVDVGGYCIDSTEVTVAQYAAFLDAVDAGASVEVSPACLDKTFVPGTGYWPPSESSDTPVSYADWCDAWSFCKWSGKRLCGAKGGGSISSKSGGTDATISQWYAACSGGKNLVYPYGNTYEPSRCNGPTSGGSPAPAASWPKCIGLGVYGGIFDLSGNMEEWEDNCGAGGTGNCYVRGGSFDGQKGVSASQDLACTEMNGPIPRSPGYYGTGFRCCAP